MPDALARSPRRATALVAVGAFAVGVLAAYGATMVIGGGDPFTGGDDPPDGDRTQAKNIILFIGDGMGAAQRNAGRLVGVGLEGELVMDSLPHVGLVQTDSADPEELVTDSAASATAYATGVKTYNGAIGMDVDGEPAPTLIEAAEATGKATGLVTTASITDASPAAFGAHVDDRGEQSEIARQFIEETGVDVLLGGGEDFWYPEGDPGAFPDNPPEDPQEESRSYRGDLVARAVELGYEYVTSASELADADGDELLGLFANQEMFQQVPDDVEGETDSYDPLVSLADMTRAALEVLSADSNGFVLVVEEEAIDVMGHANNAELSIRGVLELDEAVAVGVAFAEENADTLVIATADHETGGMSIEDIDENEEDEPFSAKEGPFAVEGTDLRFDVDWTTSSHTNVDVPLTAMGPGAQRLAGTYENTFVHEVMLEAMDSSSRGPRSP